VQFFFRRRTQSRRPDAPPRRCLSRGAILHAAEESTTISFDLIAGLPHQTPESWRNSLDEFDPACAAARVYLSA